ncbi:MAG: universal stress protein [Flavobacteriaceae bacterium]|nr:universal stress protein [Flavobacteriaceae bacterium]
MKKILVPTDFSKPAEYALNVASQLAKKHNSEIHMLHMIELPMHQIIATSNFSELPEAVFFMKIAHQKYEEALDRDYLDGLDIYENIKFNETHEGVAQYCEENDVDLIVMGSHGTSGVKEMFIGSNTEKVVRTSRTPVLVIKNEHEEFTINDFVFASDFKKDGKSTYEQAVSLAKALDSKIHLLLVNTAGNFITTTEGKNAINEFTKDSSYKNRTINIYNDLTVEKGILNFSKTIDADLIGISTHGRQGIAHFFNGSISEDLVNHANRPVITFKI